MTERTDICELSDTELEVVSGGALINGPLVTLGPIGNVAIVNSFDTQLQSNSNIGVIAGNIGSTRPRATWCKSRSSACWQHILIGST
jgi:hypothetical protein